MLLCGTHARFHIYNAMTVYTDQTHDRRTFLKQGAIGLVALAGIPTSVNAKVPYRDGVKQEESWRVEMERVLRRISAPTFAQRDFDITAYGAVAGGSRDCLPAVRAAIDECNAAGGGRVIIPAGTWLLRGPVHLKSNVNLYLADGAIVRFDPTADLYLPQVLTRWEGTELYNYSPMVYAYQVTNVAVTGKGVFDGQGKKTFATWKPDQKAAQNRLRQMGADNVPVYERVFGKGDFIRPGMIQFFGCRNVLVEGVSIIDAPFWVIHPVYCQNVIVRGVRIDSHNANNDGVDPDSSVDVLIEDCIFNTGDDSVAIKSGRDQDAWRIGQATENVVIRNCDMNSRHNGLCIGSEMSGGVRNVFMENCRMGTVESAIYFKSNLDRGGVIENVFVQDIAVERARWLIHFTTSYHSHRGGNFPPLFRNFDISKVECEEADCAIHAAGVPDAPLQHITIADVRVKKANRASEIQHADVRLNAVTVNGTVVSG